MRSSLPRRIKILEVAAADTVCEMDLGDRVVQIPRSALREILRDIARAGGDVGPGPSRPCFGEAQSEFVPP